MVRVGLEVPVQEEGEPELDEEAEDQGDVVDAFVDEAECGRQGGAPTRGEENRRCTAGQWQREEPRESHVNMYMLRAIDKDIIRGKLYVCSAKAGQEVEPLIEMNDAGLRLTDRQAPISEEFFDAGSD